MIDLLMRQVKLLSDNRISYYWERCTIYAINRPKERYTSADHLNNKCLYVLNAEVIQRLNSN